MSRHLFAWYGLFAFAGGLIGFLAGAFLGTAAGALIGALRSLTRR